MFDTVKMHRSRVALTSSLEERTMNETNAHSRTVQLLRGVNQQVLLFVSGFDAFSGAQVNLH